MHTMMPGTGRWISLSLSVIFHLSFDIFHLFAG